MSRLMKLARFNRLYNVVENLEKTAVSIGAIQRAAGLTGGRATAAEAKAMLRAQGKTGKEFSEGYKALRGKAGTNEAMNLNRAAISSDAKIIELRKAQSQINKQLKAGNLSEADVNRLQQQLKQNQQQQSARTREVTQNFKKGDADTLTQARAEMNKNPKRYENKNSVIPQQAPSKGSFVEQKAINDGALKSQYESLLVSKQVKNQAKAITGGTADPKMQQAYNQFLKNNPGATPEQFVAQSQLQAQVRNQMGGRVQAEGSLFMGAKKPSTDVKNLAQDLQASKGNYNFAQDMQNAQRLESKVKVPQGQNAQDYLVSQGQAQLNATRQAEVDRLAREMVSSGKAADMPSALTQAGQQYQSTLTPMQQIPLTPTQQVSMRYTGNATQGANTAFINPAQAQIPPANLNLNPSALTAQQNQSIQSIGNNLKGTQQVNFNNAFQAPNANQLQNMNKTIANNQNQITQSQRAASQARGNNPAQQGNGFLSQYGMPLAVGTGLLGAGYLYANSGNQQQPNPSQGGV